MPGSFSNDFTVVDGAEATTNWLTLGTAASAFVANADMSIEGTNALAARVSANCAMQLAPARAGDDMTTGNHVFVWMKTVTWGGMDTKANGGVAVTLSSDTTPTASGTAPAIWPTNSVTFNVDGSDTNIADGWVCYVVDPNGTADVTTGTPVKTSIKRYGGRFKVIHTIGAGSFKPDNVIIDAVKFGTGLTVNNGTSGSPAAMADFYAYDTDPVTTLTAYGVVQKSGGIYFIAGKIRIGTTGQAAVTFFKDTAQTLSYKDFPVSNSFYEIIVQGAASFTSTFQLGSISGSVVSGGCTITTPNANRIWTLTSSNANAITNLYACTLNNMKSAALNSASTMNGCTVTNSGTITPSGATVKNCQFQALATAAPISATYQIDVATTAPVLTGNTYTNCATAIRWNVATDTNGKLDNSTFTSGGTGHAIELGANCPSNITLTSVTFSGYAGSNGSTGNEAIYNNSGKAITINITGGTTPSIQNGTGASTTVLSNTVAVSVHVQDSSSAAAISGARVWAAVTSSAGGKPYQASVTITNSSTTATVTHTAHGLSTGDNVWIQGASLAANNGSFSITVTGTNTYTYTMGSAPGSNPTGTITSTFVVVSGTTDASGNITGSSYSYAADQPISGHVRDSSGAPYYQSANLVGTISHTSGLSTTVQLVLDQ